MKYWRLAMIVAVVLVLQLGLLPAVRPFGVVPNLLMVLIAVVGLAGAATAALFVAVVGGMMLDLASGADFGLRTSLFVLLALVAGLTHRAGLSIRGPLVESVFVVAATVAQTLAILIGMIGNTAQWPLGLIAGRLVLEVGFNLGLLLVLRPLVRWATEADTGLVVVE